MNSVDALTAWLMTRTAAQLTELLEQRRLPYSGGPGLERPARLAEQLLSSGSVLVGMAALNVAELQVLTAVAQLAERLHGPLPLAAARSGPAGFAGARAAYRQGELAVRAPEPAGRAVPRAVLLAELGAAAGLVLERLELRALLLPPHGELLTVPAVLHQQAAEMQGLGHPVALLLSAAYKSAEVRLVAGTLGLPKLGTREETQEAVVERLTDADAVRRMVADAPPEAVELLAALVPGPPLLRTHCFVPDTGAYYVGAHSKFHFRQGGSGDPGTDWLAARGLLVPIGLDLVELPQEVGAALRDPDGTLPFTPEPPPVGVRPLTARAAGEAQAAATIAATRVELLLRATAAAPPSVRKAGGLAVRDTRALAKAVGASEPQTRLWVDLAANAGLLAPLQGPTRTELVPTTRYDRWLAATPADRLVPLLAAWAVTPEVFSHWPDPEQPPVALVTPQDAEAVPLRLAVLAVLAGLPAGQGIGPAAALTEEQVEELADAVEWHEPTLQALDHDMGYLTATLAEAELLGVVAEGALTPAGRAVLALLRAGAARYFPAVPGAGPRLTGHPELAEAVAGLRAALAELVPAPLTTARFQADLTVVVPGTPAPELATLIGSLADRESDGHAVVWRIGPASVRRALDAGADAAELLERLAEIAQGGLPQTLEYLVRDTARTHGQVRVVRSSCCLRSDDEALVLELSKARALTKLGLRRIAPTVLISTASPADTLAALRRAGYAPVLEAETGTTVVERAPEQRAPATMPALDAARQHYGRGPRTAAALAEAVLGNAE
ncbi:helicase-associated domain-containing protein [Kitasatospora sp. McL0602]|uniref:helicase-associated domain-containing protein n=1 Tax=Kitasatospora sp. McL0602 TaxID=3439530 RepID=UPI003F8B66DC